MTLQTLGQLTVTFSPFRNGISKTAFGVDSSIFSLTFQAPMILDGVIKYSLHHVTAPLIEVNSSELKHWFEVCRKYNLLGQDPERYDGAAYGNISLKLDKGFIITGTQVSGLNEINDDQLCWVTQVDAANNQVYSEGPIKPSSESMTHSTLYDADSGIQAIIHVHSPELWARDLPTTSPDIAYGTPEMAEAVAELLKDPNVRDLGCIRMGGHEDGILFFSENMAKTGEKVVQIMEKS